MLFEKLYSNKFSNFLVGIQPEKQQKKESRKKKADIENKNEKKRKRNNI